MSQPQSPTSLLQEQRQQLLVRFIKGDEPHFLERHTEILDDYFRESFAGSAIGPQMRVEKNPYAIIALGGYGRKEQCLHSDVDVLLLFKKKVPDEAKDLVQEVFYPLWDIGLDVAHATRSLKESATLASQDFEVLTSLLDARFLCGISALYSDLMERLREKVLRRHGRAYVAWLADRNRERHTRYGDSTYLLEPNLKEGLGGLRDYHAMLWMGRAAYRIAEPRDLEFFGHLTHDEFGSLCEALSFIKTVRNWLHHLSGRKCDQLYFEYQVRLAKDLGYRQKNGQQAVEGFLGVLHGQMEFLKRQHLMFLRRVVNAKKPGRKRTPGRSVAAGIETVHHALDFESPEAIVKNPLLLIKIFEKSAVLRQPLAAGASRLVKEFLYLVDEGFQRSPSVIKSLNRILSASPHTFNVLNEMLTTGLMTALIPEMKGIVNRIQYDEYHLFPVDKHSLATVQTLKALRDAGPDSPDAFYGELFREIRHPELLLWAGLFHDVGKGEHTQDDHARQGAQIVRRVFKRLGFPEKNIETISFLVREHLFLIHTATRRDISDEKIVVQCARDIADIERLKMLYLLTVADSKATGPKAWNDWKATLLKEVFFKTHHILQEGVLATRSAADVVEKKRKEVFQRGVSMPESALKTLFEQMSTRYLLHTPSEAIVRHVELYERLGLGPFVIDVQRGQQKNYRTATVCARDFPGLFSSIAGVFTLNNLDILSAQINTWRNHIALDIFRVKAPPDTLFEANVWDQVNKDLRAALEGGLNLSTELDQKVRAYQSQRRKLPRQPDKIVVDNESSDFFTIIEIYTHDFPGLLYRITNTLFHCRLDVWVAKIATKADQVVDVFY
ncbi:MAG: [protein-PII] uridylyltransferase, partial [Deltaproteobacteria bacterium]